jgi:predicted HTH domain antitoxin
MSNVILELPVKFARSFGTTDEEVVRNAKLALSIEMYREGKWSTGRAAEFAGLYLGRFLDVLRERSVSPPYTEKMLEQDVAYARGCF